MKREDFESGYAKRSGTTVEWLQKHGREARPCDCGWEECEGWQMAHVGDGEKISQGTIGRRERNGV